MDFKGEVTLGLGNFSFFILILTGVTGVITTIGFSITLMTGSGVVSLTGSGLGLGLGSGLGVGLGVIRFACNFADLTSGSVPRLE